MDRIIEHRSAKEEKSTGARREQITEFLKGCRARLDPAEVGLRGSRRHRPGLRREDVAVLAGVSLRWYTWLEQGRGINVSADVLERICSTLRLTCAEREYLFALVQGRAAPLISEREDQISETLWRTIQFLPVPALVMTLRWDLVAWNHLVARIFRDYSAVPPEDRNLLRIILTDEAYQRDVNQYETIASSLLAKFRVDFSQCAGDASFEALIAEFKQTVPDFDRLWKKAEIRDSLRGSNIIQHEGLGELRFDHSSYVPEGSPFLRVLMFIPQDAHTAAAISSLIGYIPDCGPKAQSRELGDRSVFRHTNRQ